MTVTDVLAAIAAEIRSKGHYQGVSQPSSVWLSPVSSPVCLVSNTALADLVCAHGGEGIHVAYEAEREMFRRIQDTGMSLTAWNDSHTTDEVLAMLEETP